MEYKEFAEDLAKKAGEIIRQNFRAGMSKTWKKDGSPLTETDNIINRLVLDEVHRTYPSHTVLAEEESDSSHGENVWVCDPLDGTIPFAHGIPTCAFSLALIKKGITKVGVVYDPIMDRLYSAEENRGATLNSQPIHVSNQTSLDHSVVGVTGSTYLSHGHLYDIFRQQGAKVVNFYSSTYEGMLVANGEFIAVLFGTKVTYDVAALSVIIKEAGGTVTSLLGDEQPYDKAIKGALVSNGHVHQAIIDLIRPKLNDI